MEKKKIYISGKITGDPNYIEKFKEAQEILEKGGYTVLNPCIYPEGLTWEEYMHLSYAMIDCTDAVCLLPDWNLSKGARLEKEYAVKHNKQVLHFIHYKVEVTHTANSKYWNNICEIQKAQTKKGINKYGFPLEQSDNMPLLKTLQYLEEELVDALMYIEHSKEALNESIGSK